MQAWELFLQKQEAELGKDTVQKWLRNLKISHFDACNLYLEAKDTFQVLWFEEHIRNKADTLLVNRNNTPIKVHLAVAHTLPVTKKKFSRKNTKEQPSAAPFFQLLFDDLDPSYTLDEFIVKKENEFTFTILNEIAGLSNQTQLSLDTFNPLYLHGPNGSGKTHLLMGLAQVFRQKGLKTIYTRAETFTDHVVTAIRAGEMGIFRNAYRTIDVLLIDDVHIFSRKGATQEELFHTFNTLHLDGKQIILTANCTPQEMQLIEPRLISRFEWGIVLPLKILEGAERRKMLQKKIQLMQFHLPTPVVDFLVETFSSTPKSLIKSLEALMLRIHLDSKQGLHTLTVSFVKTLLADLLAEEQKSALTPAKIMHAVAEHYGILPEDIWGRSQKKECTLPRQLAMHLCREKLKLPFMKIGDLFFRDHSTVMASIQHIQKALQNETSELVNDRRLIEKKL